MQNYRFYRPFFILVLFTVVSVAAFAQTQPDFQAMLKKADSLVTFDTDFQAVYNFEQDLPGQGKTIKSARIFRRDSQNTYFIVMLTPTSDKGKGYLKSDNKLWFYDSVSKKIELTSAKDRLQNLNARNSDFTKSNLAGDYKVLSGEKQKLGKYDCWVLDLEANSDEITFPRMKIWINESNFVIKTEDYSLSGKTPVRVTVIPSYQALGNRFIPVQVIIYDMLKGATVNGKFQNEKTVYTIKLPSLVKIPDSYFSRTTLEQTLNSATEAAR